MMQLLGPFVFLVVSWMTVAQTSLAKECSYKIADAQVIDYSKSKSLGATFRSLKGLKAKSAADCAEACCADSTGRCTLGAYDPKIPIGQCLLLLCRPLEFCRTKNGSQEMQAVAIINRTDQQKIELTSTTVSSVWGNDDPDFKLPESSVKKPYNNSNNQVPNRNGTKYLNNGTISGSGVTGFKEGSNITENNLSVAQAYTSTTSGNGLVVEQHDKTSKNSTLSNLTTTPSSLETVGSSLTYSHIDNLDAEKNKSSVGRKGVMNPPEDDIESAVLLHTNVTNSPSVSSNVPTLQKHVGNNSKESDGSSETSNNFGRLHQNKTIIRTKVSNVTTNIDKLSVNTNINNTLTLNKSLPFNSVTLPVESTGVLLVTPTTVPEISNDTILGSVSTPNPMLTPTTVKSSELYAPFLNETSGNRTVTQHQAKNQTDGILDDDDEMDQSRVQAGIHLVVALVIGLLLLLTVVGLVIRRVHDVWQRRHYQRMDFLVDGMYNTVST